MLKEPILKSKLPLLGIIEAGFATPAEENNLDQISIDDWLIKDRSASFMLKVRSNSMQNAGICIGDYLIVERTNEARPGNIVIVDKDGSWTMKYFRKDSEGYYLESPDNDVLLRDEISISAVVKGVIRKY